MLCDAPKLLINDSGLPEVIEERGLAVVNVAHDGHHSRTLDQDAGVRRGPAGTQGQQQVRSTRTKGDNSYLVLRRAGTAQWQSISLVIETPWVQVLAGVVGEFSSKASLLSCLIKIKVL